MGKITSEFLELIDSKLEDKFELDNSIKFKLKKEIEVLLGNYKTLNVYNFSPNLHIQQSNFHTAPYDKGCGCTYCKIRHEYARLKLSLHRKTKAFDSFFDNSCFEEDNKFLDEFKIEQRKYTKEILQKKKLLEEIKEIYILLDRNISI